MPRRADYVPPDTSRNSTSYDTDLTTVITNLVSQQTAFQASLKSAAQTMQLSLYNYL